MTHCSMLSPPLPLYADNGALYIAGVIAPLTGTRKGRTGVAAAAGVGGPKQSRLGSASTPTCSRKASLTTRWYAKTPVPPAFRWNSRGAVPAGVCHSTAPPVTGPPRQQHHQCVPSLLGSAAKQATSLIIYAGQPCGFVQCMTHSKGDTGFYSTQGGDSFYSAGGSSQLGTTMSRHEVDSYVQQY